MLLAITFYYQKGIFKYIKKKHGRNISDVLRLFKNLKTKYEKTLFDIAYIKWCKQKHLLPTFAQVHLSNKSANFTLKRRFGRIIMPE